ncbi:S8 family serine peptidase [Verrucomicrobiaceae bacterium 227]
MIIDTGVSASQVEEAEAPLAKAFAEAGGKSLSWDFVESSSAFADENGHGTHVSGIVWRELLARSPGLPPSLVMLRTGKDRLQVDRLIHALEKIGELKKSGQTVPVILCSFALTRVDAGHEKFERFAGMLKVLLDSGTVVVAATDGKSRDLDQLGKADAFLPGCLEHSNLLTITACSKDGFLAPRAGYGSTRVFAAAHGTRVTSLWLQGGTKQLSGSSQAAALGAAEAFYCLTRPKDPASPESLRAVISKRARLHPSLLGKTASQSFLSSSLP